MKNKLFFSGIISILLIFTFMAGCNNGTTTETVTVTQYVPSPYPFAVPTEVPGPTIEVPGQSYASLVRGLLAAQEALAKKPDETPPDVVVTGQILIPRNNTITVPDHVTPQDQPGREAFCGRQRHSVYRAPGQGNSPRKSGF